MVGENKCYDYLKETLELNIVYKIFRKLALRERERDSYYELRWYRAEAPLNDNNFLFL